MGAEKCVIQRVKKMAAVVRVRSVGDTPICAAVSGWRKIARPQT